MKMISFKSYYGYVTEMELDEKLRSIFDHQVEGNYATDGQYYCIHVDHKTHKRYALTRDISLKAFELGHPLETDGEVAVFNGEKVRAMTWDEERLYNEDRLMANVDLWGNIAVDEEFDVEWYMENCI